MNLSDRELLRRVSRTFALTIRLLPAGLREPIEVAYLLARGADTVADRATAMTLEQRRRMVAALRRSLVEGDSPDLSPAIEAIESHDDAAQAERLLLGGWSLLLQRLKRLESKDRAAASEVVSRLMQTMEFELERPQLQTARELLDYTEGIAGCVGAFWTELLANHGVIDSRDRGPMSRLGRRYGRGLQLINILRDRERDAERGVRLLPPSEPPEKWLRIARLNLAAGVLYAARMNRASRRLYAATILPALIGARTIARMERGERGKIDKRSLMISLLVALMAPRFHSRRRS